MPKTKIVCTIGPASRSIEMLREMIISGMNVARLNFSHGDHDYHGENVVRIRQASEEVGKPIAILMDLQGPKLRVGKLEGDGVLLQEDEEIILTSRPVVGTAGEIPVQFSRLPELVEPGDPILMDDGLLEVVVLESTETDIRSKVVVGGLLQSNKGMNLPRAHTSIPSITQKDKQDLRCALDHQADWIALSFVRNANEVVTLQELIRKQCPYGRPTPVIAKIEKPEATDNIDAIIAADRLSDELGLDTISAGVTVAFAMELYDKGILSDTDTGGLNLNFGYHESMVTLLRLMAFREGIGDILADGTKAAAEKIGKDSEKYAMHVKGLELPGYDVRGAKGHGLNYATSYTGADHNRGYAFQEIFGAPIPYEVDRFAAEGKGKLTKWNQDVRSVACDAATMCAFLLDMAVPAIATQNTANLMEGVTGLEYTAEEVEAVGERINNLARAFNVREGFTRDDDTLPERLMTEPLKEGGSKGQFISKDDLKQMLDEYYTERGWDVNTGAPTREKLEALGLGYVADAM